MKPVVLRTALEESRWFICLLLAFALLASIGAVDEWFDPSAPPFNGRWAAFFEVVYVLAGRYGIMALWLTVAAALVAIASFIWRHTPRRPGDSWLW